MTVPKDLTLVDPDLWDGGTKGWGRMMSNDHQHESMPEKMARMEQAMRASELRYRRLFESARDGILILNADTGRINDANPFLAELLGFSKSEMIGKTVGEFSPFKDLVLNGDMLGRLQRERYVRYEDLPLETKDGRKIAVEFVSNVYQAGDRGVIQCNVRDITGAQEGRGRTSRLPRTVEGPGRAHSNSAGRGVWTAARTCIKTAGLKWNLKLTGAR